MCSTPRLCSPVPRFLMPVPKPGAAGEWAASLRGHDHSLGTRATFSTQTTSLGQSSREEAPAGNSLYPPNGGKESGFVKVGGTRAGAAPGSSGQPECGVCVPPGSACPRASEGTAGHMRQPPRTHRRQAALCGAATACLRHYRFFHCVPVLGSAPSSLLKCSSMWSTVQGQPCSS